MKCLTQPVRYKTKEISINSEIPVKTNALEITLLTYLSYLSYLLKFIVELFIIAEANFTLSKI